MGALTQVYVDPAIAGNSGTGTIGDPYGDLQYALNTVVRDATNGNQINIKAGTAEVLAAGLVLSTYGTPTEAAPLVLRGYTAAANDGGIAEINCGGYQFNGAGTWNQTTLAWLKIHNPGNNNTLGFNTSVSNHIIHCEFYKGASSPSGKTMVYLNASCTCVDSYVHDTGTNGIGIASATLAYGNYVYNSPTGINACAVVERNIIVDCATGINIGSDATSAKSNSIYSSTANTGKGILAGSGILPGVILNNIVEGYSGVGGVPVSITSDSCIVGNNAYYNCNAEALGDVRISLTSYVLSESPFVDPTNGNFAIKPWVTSIIENSYPVSWYGPAATVNRCDLGAVQNGAASSFISKFQRSRRSAYVNR